MIPKIIHYIGPNDKNKWNYFWKECKKSFEQNFKDFEFMFWDDDDIINFTKNNYPNIYDFMSLFPLHILSIDLFRFIVLFHFGGIYADLDLYCYKNFYNELDQCRFNIVEDDNFNIEIFLMASYKHNKQLLNIINGYKKEIEIKKDKFVNNYRKDYKLIFDFGVKHLYNDFLNNIDKYYILDKNLYNNINTYYNNILLTRHFCTGFWGKEVIEMHLKNHKNNDFDKYSIDRWHNKYTNNSFDSFDFYYNYYNKNIPYIKRSQTEIKNNIMRK